MALTSTVDSDPPVTADAMMDASVQFPDSVFLMGASYADLRPALLALDQRKNLGLGSILHPTPPNWVALPGYRMARRMVTNGEYQRFWIALDETGNRPFIERVDLWEMVWQQARVQNAQYSAWVSRTKRRVWTENYAAVTNAIQALVMSFNYEAFRLLNLPFPRIDQPEPSKEGELIDWVFQVIAWLLRDFFPKKQVADIEANVIAEIAPEKLKAHILDRLDRLHELISDRMRQRCDPTFAATLALNTDIVEVCQFLHRVRRAIDGAGEVRPLWVSELFFPRSWEAVTRGLRTNLIGKYVPWDKQPVMGVSLYESLAYLVWVNQQIGEHGLIARLPNEAEFERAASWPVAPLPASGKIDLDPKQKAVFPWEFQAPATANAPAPSILDNDDVMDFSMYFGDQARGLEGYYYQDRARLKALLENTARYVGPAPTDRVEMLLGFGWQWTEDRYQEAGEGLNFVGKRPRADIAATVGGQRVDVYDYASPGEHPNWSHFICRGAPEVVGGPGTTTRRFALFPLRGYDQVGFRWVLQRAEDI